MSNYPSKDTRIANISRKCLIQTCFQELNKAHFRLKLQRTNIFVVLFIILYQTFLDMFEKLSIKSIAIQFLIS